MSAPRFSDALRERLAREHAFLRAVARRLIRNAEGLEGTAGVLAGDYPQSDRMNRLAGELREVAGEFLALGADDGRH
ncbi:MAG: hypothetical protein MUE46_11165 [Xanthomonadales bacterium]|nr:hypothetical protein [Xanthomonadales bacterium]